MALLMLDAVGSCGVGIAWVARLSYRRDTLGIPQLDPCHR
jgi:hypothetical protein